MSLPAGLTLFLATIAFMEGFAYVMHRWVMHGRCGWRLHASHHRARRGAFELNDLYGVIFAVPSIVLLYGGVQAGWGDWAAWVGAGIAGYGAIYFGFHDVIVHRRVAHRVVPRSAYLRHRAGAPHPSCGREPPGGGELRVHLRAAGRGAEGASGGERGRRGQGAAPRVHSPSRLTVRAGSRASTHAPATARNLSAFDMLMRWSQARGPSSAARVATSP